MAFVTCRQGAFFHTSIELGDCEKKNGKSEMKKNLGQKKLAGVGEMVTGL